jgi:ElaA protein
MSDVIVPTTGIWRAEFTTGEDGIVAVSIARIDEIDARTLYGILRLRAEVFIVEQDCAYQDVDGRDLEPGTRHIWLTGADAEPVAYLRVLDEPDGSARVGRVCVSPAARRRGHAGTLLTAALAEIGDRESVLSAQSYAVDLYAAAGYLIDGPEFLEDGIPHLPMRRPAGVK